MTLRTRFSRIFLAAVVTAAVVAPAAQAGDPTGSQYQNSVTQIQRGVGGGNGNASTRDSGPLNSPVVSGLPFTGLDLVALGAVAIALMSLGLVLRRLTVPSPLK